MKDKIHDKWSHILYLKTCEICGESFYGKKKQRTCSRKCGAALRLQEGTHSRPLVLDITKEELIKLYEVENMTLLEISELKEMGYKHIWNLFNHYEIPRRKASKRNQKGENNDSWKGGRVMNKGYIEIRCEDHPKAKEPGYYIPEATLVMEKHLGRYLTQTEVVHHINGIKTDNSLENLQLMPKSGEGSHIGLHNMLRGKVVML